MTRLNSLLLVALGCSALSCSNPALAREVELNEAQQRWDTAAVSSYEVEMFVGCFCLPSLTRWSRVRVTEGTIVGVWEVEEGTPVDSTLWQAWTTVEELFDKIAEGPDGSVIVRIDVEYHPVLGYPIYANFIESQYVADAAVSYSLRNFEQLTP